MIPNKKFPVVGREEEEEMHAPRTQKTSELNRCF
jgi:hypothetical protein